MYYLCHVHTLQLHTHVWSYLIVCLPCSKLDVYRFLALFGAETAPLGDYTPLKFPSKNKYPFVFLQPLVINYERSLIYKSKKQKKTLYFQKIESFANLYSSTDLNVHMGSIKYYNICL